MAVLPQVRHWIVELMRPKSDGKGVAIMVMKPTLAKNSVADGRIIQVVLNNIHTAFYIDGITFY